MTRWTERTPREWDWPQRPELDEIERQYEALIARARVWDNELADDMALGLKSYRENSLRQPEDGYNECPPQKPRREPIGRILLFAFAVGVAYGALLWWVVR